jgi:nitroreductase
VHVRSSTPNTADRNIDEPDNADGLFRAFADVVTRRRSVRGFLPTPIPEHLLREIFVLAREAPSNCNTQPWLTYVVSGERRVKLRESLLAAVTSESPSVDVPYESKLYAGIYKERQQDCAARLYAAMGIAREDQQARAQALLENYGFFGAPHVGFICVPSFAGLREMVDVGMYVQTLMLGMAAHGIASCPQTALGMYVRPVRAALDIPADQKLLLGLSFGYEDQQVAANSGRMPRASLSESTVFLSQRV